MSPATLPRVACHEFAGEICAHGEDLSIELRDKLKIGTPVGVPVRAYHPCGQCFECEHTTDDPEGYGVFCPRAGRLDVSLDGGFQDFVCVDARQVEPIPHPLTPMETAPLMCAGLTIFAALRRVQAECRFRELSCDKVAIIGASGGLGHLGVQFAVKMGFSTVVATDASDGALSVIQKVTHNLSESEKKRLVVADVRVTDATSLLSNHFSSGDIVLSGETGVDAAIILPECLRAFDYGMKLLRRHGTCCVVSFPKAGFVMDPNDLIFRDIKLPMSLIGTKTELRDMMHLAARTGIQAHTRSFALEDLNELVKDYHQGGGGKLVIDMNLKST